jgi:hypothetical protein
MPRYVLPLFVAVFAAGAIWLVGEKTQGKATDGGGSRIS